METATALKRKVKAPHPSTSKHRANVHRRPPPLPPKPSSSTHSAKGTSSTLPIKNLQGIRTRRTDSTKDGWERDVVFVTRNTPLGALMGRCRGLIMDEGYTRIRLHALAAAIPHAILLLHALLDLLPYPRGDRGMWYEIRTGSTECIDEVRPPSRKGKGKAEDGHGDVQMETAEDGQEEEELDLDGIGAVEEDEPERRVRLKSSIEIDLHIGPKRSKPLPAHKQPVGSKGSASNQDRQPGPPTISKRNRPSKRKREVTRRQHLDERGGKRGEKAQDQHEDDEEAAMNEMNDVAPAKPAGVAVGNRSGKMDKAQAQATSRSAPRRQAGSEDEEEEELENR